MAIFAMIFSLFAPVGCVLAGALASVVDPRAPLIVGGIACSLGAVGFGVWSRSGVVSSGARCPSNAAW